MAGVGGALLKLIRQALLPLQVHTRLSADSINGINYALTVDFQLKPGNWTAQQGKVLATVCLDGVGQNLLELKHGPLLNSGEERAVKLQH